MSTIVLGCDENGDDSKWQDTVAKALEKQGHTVEKLEIDPGPFANYSYSSKANGKIGVYIMADSLVSVADLGLGNTSFKYGYFIIRGDLGLPRMSTMSDFQNNPIGRDADCTSICDKLAGKTYPQMNEIVKDKCHIVFGTTPEEGANNLIKAMGGESTDSNSNSSSGSTIKDAICDVMYGWDGDAELFIRDDTVYIRKIRSPSTAKLRLVEGENVHLDSVNIADFNPYTVNCLTCNFKGYNLKIQDDYLIKRFGKIAQNIKIDDDSVKTLDQAKEYFLREWAKLKRDNGHSLECKVKGHSQWKQGEWCWVYLPSFNIDDYMYIIYISQDDSEDEWGCNLKLVDYPPGFGEPTNINDGSEDNDFTDFNSETTGSDVT